MVNAKFRAWYIFAPISIVVIVLFYSNTSRQIVSGASVRSGPALLVQIMACRMIITGPVS